MKVLIVGGNSSVANELKFVLKDFAEILTAGRTECDIYLDLNEVSIPFIFPDDIDVIIHTSAHFGGGSDQQLLDAEKVNVLGTLKLCQAAVHAKAKHFIFISSIFSSIDYQSERCSIYSLSKRHAEEIALFYCSRQPIILTILKPSQLYGNSETFRRHQPFFYFMIDKAEKGENIEIYGSHDPLRNFIHVRDLAYIIKNVAEKRIGGIFSCTSMRDISYTQIANAAFSAFNTQGKVSYLNDKPNIPDNIFDKDNSLYDLIDYYPGISIEVGLQELAYYRKQNH